MAPSLAFTSPLPLASLRPSARASLCPRASLGDGPAPESTVSISAPETKGAPAWLGSVLSSRGALPTSPALAAAVSRGVAVAERGTEKGKGLDALPNRRQESWRFTDLRTLYDVRVGDVSEGLDVGAAVERMTPAEAGGVLVFVDGVFESKLSNAGEIGDVGGYAGGLDGFEGDVESLLAGFEKAEAGAEKSGVFAAVSAALAKDVCVITVPEGVTISKPLAVVCISSGGKSQETATASAPRIALHAAKGACVTVLETHSTVSEERPWSCVMSATCVDVAEGAKVDHYVLNDAPDSAHLVSHIHSDVGKEATYKMRGLTVGSRVGRITLGIDLNDEGAHGEAFGVMIVDGRRVADLHSRIAHNAPSCTSNQFQKNIAGDAGRVIFSGKILVKQIAQETDSEQLCRSMLLSNKARIDAMPVLEIEADQVKCTHGATIADLNQEELFYLLSRGISRSKAQELLLSSFVLDVLADCPFAMLKDVCITAAEKLIPGIQQIAAKERTELYQSV